jgi:hypothetical protein
MHTDTWVIPTEVFSARDTVNWQGDSAVSAGTAAAAG